jgi:flagellar basal body-associated protein FliL
MKNMNNRKDSTWKRILFIVVLLTISVAAFEIVFLYDFSAKASEEVMEPKKVELWLFLVISLLTFVPCIALGYGRVNALYGIIPPLMLNSISWYIILDNIKRQGIFEISSKSGIMVFAAGVAILSGFFGIVITLLAKKGFDYLSIDSPKTEMSDKTTKTNAPETENLPETVSNSAGEEAPQDEKKDHNS